jgi:hypothetical protein
LTSQRRRVVSATAGGLLLAAMTLVGLTVATTNTQPSCTRTPATAGKDTKHALIDLYANLKSKGTPTTEVDRQVADQMCLQKLSRPDAMQPVDVTDNDVAFDPVEIWFDPQYSHYYVAASYHWLNNHYRDGQDGYDCTICLPRDPCNTALNVGQGDGIAVKIAGDGYANLSSSATTWGNPYLNDQTDHFEPTPLRKPAGQDPGNAVYWPELGANGAAWSFQGMISGHEKCADLVLGNAEDVDTDFNGYGAALVMQFDLLFGDCRSVNALATYRHTWDETKITAVTVTADGKPEFTVTDEDKSKQFPGDSGSTSLTVCPNSTQAQPLPPWALPNPLKFMIMGDSITQGLDGDYTWRYRLWQHLQPMGTPIAFVGPHQGTSHLQATWDPNKPSDPVFDGKYHDGVSFDTNHFAQWGWQATQATSKVSETVATYMPQYLLVELGFNDLAWGVSDPAGTLSSIKTIIHNARAVDPTVRILVGNVVHRTYLPNLPNLDATITDYDNRLASALPGLDQAQSPVRLVDLASAYTPYTDAYDGLHPNSLGEYKIARAFANVLDSQFGIGGPFGSIPSAAEPITLGVPTVTVDATDAGMKVSWNPVPRASGYRFFSRDVTAGGVLQALPLPIPAYSWLDTSVQPGHTYEYAVEALHGDQVGDQSAPQSKPCTAKTTTPGDVTVIAGPTYLDLIWGPAPPVAGGGDLQEYIVYYLDISREDENGGIPQPQESAGITTRINGLVPGDTYGVYVVAKNQIGPGYPSGGPVAVVGTQTPTAPVLTGMTVQDGWDVHMSWSPVSTAAGYWIYMRDVTDPNSTLTRLPWELAGYYEDFTAGYLFSGADNYEFCITAANGSMESPMTCSRPTLPAPHLDSVSFVDINSVHLTWDPLPGAGYYKIVYRTPGSTTFTTYGVTTQYTGLDVYNITPLSTDYEYCVVGVTPSNVQSTPSNCMAPSLISPS